MEERRDTGRIEAFSDGVFAIAITLLILEVIIAFKPHEGVSIDKIHLLDDLLTKWPVLAAFATSFVTIGIMWINHHRLFTLITRVDHTLLILNIFLLLAITFVPFPTALLGELATLEVHDAAGLAERSRLVNEAALLYSGTFTITAILFNVFWRYATFRGRLLSPDVDMQAVKRVEQQYLFGPAMYGLAFALAFVDARLSLGLNALLAIFFLFPGIELRRSAKARQEQPAEVPSATQDDQLQA